MNRLEIKKIELISDLAELKKGYFASSTSPLDGMWHFGFVPMSEHFGFYEDNILVGFLCLNGEGYILQFYLSAEAKVDARDLFTLVSQGNSQVIGTLKGAYVSTAETAYLSLCLDNSRSFKVNALMYQEAENANLTPDDKLETSLVLSLADQAQLSDFVRFAASNIGAPEDWLTGYYTNLIKREELWGYWVNNQLLASGECRFFDEYQTQYADLGMIVAVSERGQGLATRVLKSLKNLARKQGLATICSTESGNIAAQKALSRAGFVTSNRIIQFEFEPS
jgi:RimJ/RimL family protein N-acetyltransferase